METYVKLDKLGEVSFPLPCLEKLYTKRERERVHIAAHHAYSLNDCNSNLFCVHFREPMLLSSRGRASMFKHFLNY